MRTLVLGMDGYIGWSLSMHLAKRGHTVSGVDNLSRRDNVESVGSQSAIPILDMEERVRAFKRIHGENLAFFEGDLLNYDFLADIIKQTRPDSIVHLAEQPSAPFSMIDREHAIYSQHNNVEGTLNVLYAMKDIVPDCHLVKLGTMGEYGTPNIDIPEGFFEIEYRGRKDILPFPKQPHSMYHLSKVHDTANTMFACRVWKLSSTDIMQGVVYGTRTDEMIDDSLMTRFDFDESFGTVINRYCAEAVIGLPLTPYGQGKQKRGFIDLVDSIQCLQ
jgi:UDP-sulfoquinovose synthase